MFSVITVYRKEKYFENVRKSFPQFQVIGRKASGISILKLYEEMITEAKNQWIIIVHDDIFVLDPPAKLLNFHLNKDNLYGVAGASKFGTIGRVLERFPSPHLSTHFWATKPIEVDTIDSCFMIIHKDLFKKLEKVEYYLTHFLAEEWSLQTHKLGGKVIVLPFTICHYSLGGKKYASIRKKYFPEFRNRWKKYRKEIYTTVEGKLVLEG